MESKLLFYQPNLVKVVLRACWLARPSAFPPSCHCKIIDQNKLLFPMTVGGHHRMPSPYLHLQTPSCLWQPQVIESVLKYSNLSENSTSGIMSPFGIPGMCLV